MYKNNLFLFITLSFIFIACQKEGDFQEQLQYTDFRVTWAYNLNPGIPYTIELNGIPITDSLIYNDPEKNFAAKMFALTGSTGRLLVKEGEEQKLVLDTVITITNRTHVRLVQLSAEGKPFVAGGVEGEVTDPEARDMTDLQLIYVNPRLPDSIRVNFYVLNLATFEVDMPYAHSYVLRRGVFSEYQSFRFVYGPDMIFMMEVEDPRTGEMIQAYDLNTFFPGLANTVYNSSGKPVPDLKRVTGIIEWGGPDDPMGYVDLIYDYPLFSENW